MLNVDGTVVKYVRVHKRKHDQGNVCLDHLGESGTWLWDGFCLSLWPLRESGRLTFFAVFCLVSF